MENGMENGMENEKELIELRKEFIGKRVTLDFDEVDDLRFVYFVNVDEFDLPGLEAVMDLEEEESAHPTVSYTTSRWVPDQEGAFQLDDASYEFASDDPEEMDAFLEKNSKEASIEVQLEVWMDEEDYITELDIGIYYNEYDLLDGKREIDYSELDLKRAREFLSRFTQPRRGRHRKVRRI